MTDKTSTTPDEWFVKNWKRLATWAVLIIAGLWLLGAYNGLMRLDQGVQEASGNIQSLYQRRANLIPNLVATVQAAGFNERDTLTQVQEARSKATQVTIDPRNASPEQLQAMQAAQGQLSAALGKLMMVREAYPDLKTNQNFLNLQSQIEGSENRVQVATQRYNAAARELNTAILSFPSNVVNTLAGRKSASMFQADAGAEAVPSVTFKRN